MGGLLDWHNVNARSKTYHSGDNSRNQERNKPARHFMRRSNMHRLVIPDRADFETVSLFIGAAGDFHLSTLDLRRGRLSLLFRWLLLFHLFGSERRRTADNDVFSALALLLGRDTSRLSPFFPALLLFSLFQSGDFLFQSGESFLQSGDGPVAAKSSRRCAAFALAARREPPHAAPSCGALLPFV